MFLYIASSGEYIRTLLICSFILVMFGKRQEDVCLFNENGEINSISSIFCNYCRSNVKILLS